MEGGEGAQIKRGGWGGSKRWGRPQKQAGGGGSLKLGRGGPQSDPRMGGGMNTWGDPKALRGK